MLLWAQLLIGATLALASLQKVDSTEADAGEVEASSSPQLDIVNRDSLCFNVKPEACNLTATNDCKCKSVNSDSVYCCQINTFDQFRSGLKCSGKPFQV